MTYIPHLVSKLLKFKNRQLEFPLWRSGNNPSRNHKVAGWIPGLA